MHFWRHAEAPKQRVMNSHADRQNMVAKQDGYGGDVPQAAAATGGAGLTLSWDDEEHQRHIPYDDGKSAAYAFLQGLGGWFRLQTARGLLDRDDRLALIVEVEKHGCFARTMHAGGTTRAAPPGEHTSPRPYLTRPQVDHPPGRE